ncbi:Hypothetical protein MVR_LOCUS200 [uncultured virus]|nr:Hypothetical protein MVR_LOCUS200 [uncultured virus]
MWTELGLGMSRDAKPSYSRDMMAELGSIMGRALSMMAGARAGREQRCCRVMICDD